MKRVWWGSEGSSGVVKRGWWGSEGSSGVVKRV